MKGYLAFLHFYLEYFRRVVPNVSFLIFVSSIKHIFCTKEEVHSNHSALSTKCMVILLTIPLLVPSCHQTYNVLG